MKQEGYSLTGYILKRTTRVENCTESSGNKERNKENKKDYTSASSHWDIGVCLVEFRKQRKKQRK